MHPRLAAPIALAEETRARLLAYLDTLSPEQMGSASREGGWTVAQHLAHLHLVEMSSVRALFRAFRTARDNGLGMETETSPPVGGLTPAHLLNVTTRIAAPEIVHPADTPDADTVRARLAESRAGLHTWAREADGYALGTVTFPHPVLGTLNLYEWVAMIDGHEQRHMLHMHAITDSKA